MMMMMRMIVVMVKGMMMMHDDDDYDDIDGEVSLPYPPFTINHANIYMYQIAYPRAIDLIIQDDDDDP